MERDILLTADPLIKRDDEYLNSRIERMNSLTISDQQYNSALSMRPMLPSRASTPIGHLFNDSPTLFQPQSGSLFNPPSFSPLDKPSPFVQSSLDKHHPISRRESYPNLSSLYTSNEYQYPPQTNLRQGSVQMRQKPDWPYTYLGDSDMNSVSGLSFNDHGLRKYSLDAVPSLALKEQTRFNRSLMPSYSNPDLISSARRTGSVDAGRGRLLANPSYEDFQDHPCFVQQQPTTTLNLSCNTHNNSLVPPYLNSYHLSSNNSSHSGTQTPFIASRLIHQMATSRSRPPSPPSRKQSIIPHQLRRASSASIMNTASINSTQCVYPDPMLDAYATVNLEDVVEDLFALCQDQHGCRFFQKKLEEQDPQQRDQIFTQIYPHFVKLMTDPFGNYLCQKMMEYCTEEQRTMLVEKVCDAIMVISLNMHGTRAIQKMIEFLKRPEQIAKTIEVLSPKVVALIKDINGNHVIQKCLNCLSFADKQFIYDAVSENCIEVATHRHGCCVFQRCVDFAAPDQKQQLVNEIIKNALRLVQDPYGNYVVQYVLELGDAEFSDRLIKQFIGHTSELSVQKYSSNVMEKCIRVAEEDTRSRLIEEMISKPQLEKLLQDSYANYVVQTALDFSNEAQHQKLSEHIKPLLSLIRNTSYCKRIQGKLVRDLKQQKHARSSYSPSASGTSNYALMNTSVHSLTPHRYDTTLATSVSNLNLMDLSISTLQQSHQLTKL